MNNYHLDALLYLYLYLYSSRPKETDQVQSVEDEPVPFLAPPPKSPQNSAYSDATLRFNPFDKSGSFAQEAVIPSEIPQAEITRTDSQVRSENNYYNHYCILFNYL